MHHRRLAYSLLSLTLISVITDILALIMCCKRDSLHFLTAVFDSPGMINRLNLDERGDDMSFLSAVAKDTFSDGVTNWGRIASLLSFSAELCRHLKNNRKEHCIDQVASLISSYLLSDQLEWLINNKAWVSWLVYICENSLKA